MKTTKLLEYSGRGAGKTRRLKETLDQSPGAVVVVKDEAARGQMVQYGINRDQVNLFQELVCPVIRTK